MLEHPVRSLNCITPPHLLQKLMESRDRTIRDAALRTLLATAELRGQRLVRATAGFLASPAGGRRTIYDCRNSTYLPAAIVARTEDGPPSADPSANRAFDGLGTTRDFYKEEFERNSIDGSGMRLDGYVHRGVHYNNAFWDGQEMVFGDGDGVVFTDFTQSLDVIGHELAHGVTEFTAGLEYERQPGALNESMSDVFGSLVKQWSLKQTADDADWLIGGDIFTPSIGADALRSMKAPGTAYDNELLGKDPQPDHMDRYYEGSDDNFGVHINSGIPNKAFYLTAVGIGGYAWETAGHIWYESLLASHKSTQFQGFAELTYLKAGLYGVAEQSAVLNAWREVGIRISSAARSIRRGSAVGRGDELARGPATSECTDAIAALSKQIEAMANQIKALTKEVKTMSAEK